METFVRTKIFLLSLVVLFLSETVGSSTLLLLVKDPNLMQMWLRLSQIFVFIFIFLAIERSTASLGLRLKQIVPGLKSGLIWSFVFGIAVFFVSGVLFLAGKIPPKFLQLRFPEQISSGIFLSLLLRGIIGPVAEEIFFRGILYGFLRRWGMFPAIFLSSSLFVLAHRGAGFPQIIGSVVFAVAYETEKNLMTPIVIHCLGNITLFLLSIVFAK